MKSKFTVTLFLALMTHMILVSAENITDTDIHYSFYPYKDGTPSIEGMDVGKVINASNVDSVKENLDPGTYQFIKDGYYEIEIGKTLDFELHPDYIKASQANLAVTFDEKGMPDNYINGRPFPYKPLDNDPDAGKKLIWNFQYGRVWGDLGCMEPWYWDYRDMRTEKLERTIVFDRVCMKRSAFKTTDSPIPSDEPNPGNVYRKIYLRASEPFDVKNTQLLLHKNQDDTKPIDAWIYLGFQRRVRRLSTGQMTDAFLGSDVMVEDFEGYEGKVSDFNWEYQGEKTLLMPFWNHNEAVAGKAIERSHTDDSGEKYDYTPMTGRAGCFPDAPWMLRKVYIVKGTPKDTNHPVGYRIHYIDAQTNEIPMTLVHDRGGKYWKWFMIGWPNLEDHLDINKGKGAMIGDVASMVDVQAQHCTTLSFFGKVDSSLADEDLFSVQNMRQSGK